MGHWDTEADTDWGMGLEKGRGRGALVQAKRIKAKFNSLRRLGAKVDYVVVLLEQYQASLAINFSTV